MGQIDLNSAGPLNIGCHMNRLGDAADPVQDMSEMRHPLLVLPGTEFGPCRCTDRLELERVAVGLVDGVLHESFLVFHVLLSGCR